MGDCRIRIVIAKDLISTERQQEIIQSSTTKKIDILDEGVIVSETATTLSWIRMFSADTTVREVVAQGSPELWGLYTISMNDTHSSSSWKDLPFQLWDCTLHPPKDISDWPTEKFAEVTGPKSKTLQDAGCFPSGTWMVLPRGVTPSQFNKNNTNYDGNDAQNNQLVKQQQNPRPSGATAANLVVEFKNPCLDFSSATVSKKPLPSQVMASVAQRFAEEHKKEEAQAQQARATRLENQEQSRKRQQERAFKLDRRIQQLEEQSASSEGKNKAVSDRVRQMLVKSRATGDKRLKQQDRLYFECILDWTMNDEDDSKSMPLVREFRYFSPQDTFAKIGLSFSFGGPPTQTGSRNVEVLVRRQVAGDLRRFPVAMRVYEAISEKFLSGDQDRLIIRWFNGETCDASPSILDDIQDQTRPILDESSNDVEMTDATRPTSKDAGPGDARHERQHAANFCHPIVDENMAAAIRAMDDETNKGKKLKKASAASIKVRTMQIKSKAKGDAKRIPKVEDRFFLEVILLESGSLKASSSFQFVANKDPLQRIVQGVASSNNTTDWEFFVPHQNDGETMTYNKISDTSMVLADAAAKDILKPFDRLILRPK